LQGLQTPKNPTVEEASDDEDTDLKDDDFLEQGFFFLDEEPTSEEDSDDCNTDDEEVDEDELKGPQNEADIEYFNAVLAHAQVTMVSFFSSDTCRRQCCLKLNILSVM